MPTIEDPAEFSLENRFIARICQDSRSIDNCNWGMQNPYSVRQKERLPVVALTWANQVHGLMGRNEHSTRTRKDNER